MQHRRLKLFFISLFILIAFYILAMKTEKFQSSSIVMIKDLSSKQSASMLGSMLLGQSSSSMQDSKILELYINSSEMFQTLDAKYHLAAYYTSDEMDLVQRLSEHAFFSFNRTTGENLLRQYQKDLSILYDEPSATLTIGFQHADPKIAQLIVKEIIQTATATLNRFEKENAQVALTSLMQQEKENKALFTDTIKKLIAYQNQHQTIDPNIDVQSKSTILANLESELIQKEVAYKSKLGYLNKNATEVQLLRDTIYQLKQSIRKIKKQIAGNGKNELNTNVSEFELLKSEVDFNKERYKQTLIKLEETKVSVKQNAKNLIVVTQPTLAQTYSEPNKFKDILSLMIILSFLYGIFTLILSILKEHKD